MIINQYINNSSLLNGGFCDVEMQVGVCVCVCVGGGGGLVGLERVLF